MPHFFRKKGYIDNMSIWDCPFQMGRQTDQSIHEWTQGRPELIHYYNRYTQSHHKMLRPFTDVYPIEDLFDDMEPDQPFFIDVGGGYGQQALAIKVTYPYARVILEDLPTQLRGLDLGEDVEIIPQDCFEEQKIKGNIRLPLITLASHATDNTLTTCYRGADLLSAACATRLSRCSLCDYSSEFGRRHGREVRNPHRRDSDAAHRGNLPQYPVRYGNDGSIWF